jgi:hypothetical protein
LGGGGRGEGDEGDASVLTRRAIGEDRRGEGDEGDASVLPHRPRHTRPYGLEGFPQKLLKGGGYCEI